MTKARPAIAVHDHLRRAPDVTRERIRKPQCGIGRPRAASTRSRNLALARATSLFSVPSNHGDVRGRASARTSSLTIASAAPR
jgi:hypothetical protein